MEYLQVKRKVVGIVAAMDHPLKQHELSEHFTIDLTLDLYFECRGIIRSKDGADFDWEKYVDLHCTVDRFVKNAQAELEQYFLRTVDGKARDFDIYNGEVILSICGEDIC